MLRGVDGGLGDADEHAGCHGGLEGFVQEGGGSVGDQYARNLSVEPVGGKDIGSPAQNANFYWFPLPYRMSFRGPLALAPRSSGRNDCP